MLHESLLPQWQLLIDNIGRGNYETFNAPVFPKGEQRGVGFHEAPRGTLSHWVVIEDGRSRTTRPWSGVIEELEKIGCGVFAREMHYNESHA